MEYIGQKIIRYGDHEFIGEQYLMDVDESTFNTLLSVCSIAELKSYLQSSTENELYEQCDLIKAEIEKRELI